MPKCVGNKNTSDRLKTSSFAADEGSFISKTLEVELKSNAELEHVKTTEGSESGKNNE